MTLIFRFCTILSVICIGVSELGFDCRFLTESNIIYLVRVRSRTVPTSVADKSIFKRLDNLYKKFMDKCADFYEFTTVDELDTGLKNTLKLINKKSNIINLHVQDYYNYINHKSINRNRIVYAGNLYDEHQIKTNVAFHLKTDYSVHLTNFSNKQRSKQCLAKTREMNNITYNLPAVKIMSKNVSKMNSGDLLDFVTKLHYSGTKVKSRESCLGISKTLSDLKTVLICSDDWIPCFDFQPYSEALKFRPIPLQQCKQKIEVYKNNLLAILAPTPFEMDSEFTIPTVFYETTREDSEIKTEFPNSMKLLASQSLKYGFLKFIKDMGWRRIAIVSDDSPFSIEFENGLLKLFSEEGIIYNVQGCSKRDCEFKKAINNLKSMDAKIIIANVDEVNAKLVYEEYRRYHHDRFTVIYRVWPFWSTRNDENIISISLAPAMQTHKSCNVGSVTKNPRCTGLLHGLSTIVKTHTNFNDTASLTRKDFFRLFTERMNTIAKPKSVAYLARNEKEISAIDIYNPVSYKIPFKTIPSDQSWCLTKTNNFAKPCDKPLILMFMLVITMFIIMVLLTICFFHRTSPIYSVGYTQL